MFNDGYVEDFICMEMMKPIEKSTEGTSGVMHYQAVARGSESVKAVSEDQQTCFIIALDSIPSTCWSLIGVTLRVCIRLSDVPKT